MFFSKNKISLSASFVFMASAVNAEPVTTIVDNQMGRRIFIIDNNIDTSGGISTVERALSDDVVGVYCRWKSSAVLDAKKKSISNFKPLFFFCRVARENDVAKWQGGTVINFSEAATNAKYTQKREGDRIIEKTTTGPSTFGVVSEYKRVWDKKKGEVCLSMSEGIMGQKPYSVRNIGCYKKPAVS